MMCVLFLVSCERTDVSFESYDELVQENALQSGWYPLWLPESSTDIREAHDIDTNDSMLSARVRDPAWRMPTSCREVDAVPPAPFARSWWPTDVSRESGWALFACEPGEYAAMHDVEKILLRWRPDGS